MNEDYILILLDKSRFYSGRYKSRLANHLPMALVALHQMGAGRQALERFYEYEILQLEPKPSGDLPMEDGAIASEFGRHDHEGELSAYFQKRVETDGIQKILHEYVDRLMPGVVGGAFHPMIQVYYGTIMPSPGAIADGLANWVGFYRTGRQPLSAGGTGTLTIDDFFTAMRQTKLFGRLKASPLFIEETLLNVADDEEFSALFAQLKVDEELLPQLEIFLARVFVHFKNFTLLHGITSLQAFRSLVPYMKDGKACLTHYLRFLLAAYVAIGMPPAADDFVPASLDWNTIKQKAMQSLDDHVIKFIYTCSRLAQDAPDGIYQRLAEDMAKQPPSYLRFWSPPMSRAADPITP